MEDFKTYLCVSVFAASPLLVGIVCAVFNINS